MRGRLVVLRVASVLAGLLAVVGRGDTAAVVPAGLGPGINILGYDGLWDGGVNAPFRVEDFRLIRQAGFSHVRINVHAFRHMDGAGMLPATFFRHLDWAVEGALAEGLRPVVDEHDTDLCQSDPPACGDRLRTFWRQVSVHYAGRYPQIVFELLNEPGGQMTAEQWNALAEDLLRIIRVGHPSRTVMVAALNVDEPAAIEKLRLPEADRNIVVTHHYYRPMAFTHQGAPWAPEFARTPVDWGSEADKAAVRRDLDVVSAWAGRTGRPIHLGEFGVFEAAGEARRARWLEAVRREAKERGWSWSAWQFDHDFAIYDRARNRWTGRLLQALVPAGRAGGR